MLSHRTAQTALGLLLALDLGSLAATRAHGSEGGRFQHFAVAADHPSASEAGASVIRAGGNAADAAAATMLALGVVSPAGSGLGGGGFALYYRASDKSLSFIDFREKAGAAANATMFHARSDDSAEETAGRSRAGGLSVAVPGEPLGVETLQRRFGKLTLARVVEPAVALAGDGFEVSSHVRRMLGFLGLDSTSDPLFNKLFGGPGEPKDRTKNPELAVTLRTLGAHGSQAFYRGAIAQQIVKRVRAAGGLLTAKDLADYRIVDRAPLRAEAFGHTWVTAPPPSAGGYTVVSSLAMLEHLGKAGHVPNGQQRLHALIESWKGPYLDRARYFGDPDQVSLPLEALSADARRQARAARFHPVLARPPQQYALPLDGQAQGPLTAAEDHGTSHLCVVDAEGNIAAITTTVNLPFGAQVSVGGMWLNDQMDDFAREVGKDNAFGLLGGEPNLPGPRKRPISSMTPAIVFSADKPVLCIGGSGGSRIPTAVEQVALYVLADGMTPEAALVAPRVHHQGSPDHVELRGGDPALAQELSARGHDVTTVSSSAAVQLITIAEGELRAASDPGKGGAPRGD